MNKRLVVALLGTVSALAWQSAVHAADLMSPVPVVEQKQTLPAVSAVNGKWELDAGFLQPGGGAFRAAGSLSLPLGDRFGVQGDVMATSTSGGLAYGGALHLFTRDPDLYLAGVTAGIVVAPGATITAIGGEGELYLDRISLEGWAGLAAVDYVDPMNPDVSGLFAMGDIAYYPTDDLRLTLGASSVIGDTSLHGGAEYLIHDFGMPLSLTADARVHSGGNYSFTVGLKGYFGGNDDGKSLIDRQRQDDPRNRGLDLFGAASTVLADVADAPTDPEFTACVADAGSSSNGSFYPWFWDGSSSTCTLNDPEA